MGGLIGGQFTCYEPFGILGAMICADNILSTIARLSVLFLLSVCTFECGFPTYLHRAIAASFVLASGIVGKGGGISAWVRPGAFVFQPPYQLLPGMAFKGSDLQM